MNRLLRRALTILGLGMFAMQSACDPKSQQAFNELCAILGAPLLFPNVPFSMRDGETVEAELWFLRRSMCTTPGSLSLEGFNTDALVFVPGTLEEIAPSAARPGAPLPSDDDERLMKYSFSVRAELAGSFSASLRYVNDEADYDETFPLTVISAAARGTVNVQITGLPANLAANVFVGDEEDGIVITSSRSLKMFAGLIDWDAEPVMGPDGTVYTPTPMSGEFELGINETRVLNIVYSAAQPALGWANLQLTGLPTSGVTGGTVNITGNGTNMIVPMSGMIELSAGVYNFTASPASTTNNDYAPPQATQQVTITGGQVTNVLFAYAIVATLVNFQVLGLELGLLPSITLTRGSETRMITSATAQMKLAVGLWTIAVAERLISIRRYRATGSTPTSLDVPAQATPLSTVLLRYYCAAFAWQVTATLGLSSDQFNHLLFIGLVLGALPLDILWLFVDPFPAEAGRGMTANQNVTQETVTISGPAPFISVTGTRAANGTLNLTGSGTAAGFSNVPAVLTGTLTSAGALTNGLYRLGQSQAPTGLPSGPIIYTLTSPAPPPSFNLFAPAAARR
jgi:hypothetical protein